MRKNLNAPNKLKLALIHWLLLLDFDWKIIVIFLKLNDGNKSKTSKLDENYYIIKTILLNASTEPNLLNGNKSILQFSSVIEIDEFV